VPGVDYMTPAGVDLTTKVDKDSVVVSATRILANKLLAGDANPVFQFSGGGAFQWGPGGASALDSQLKRAGVNALSTPGSFAPKSLIATDAVTVDNANLGSKLLFGTAADANLYRRAANNVGTDGAFSAGFALYAGYAFSNPTTSAFGVIFGSGADTSLYRKAAGVLRTDGTLDANALTINGVAVGGAVDITGKVDKDSLTIGADRILANKLNVAHANPAFQILGDGRIGWVRAARRWSTPTSTASRPGPCRASPSSVACHTSAPTTGSPTKSRSARRRAASSRAWRSAARRTRTSTAQRRTA
jgi:hypothetical protein